MATWIKVIIDFLSNILKTVQGKQEFKALTYEDRKDLYHAEDAIKILEAKQDSVRQDANLKIQIVRQDIRSEKKIKKLTDGKRKTRRKGRGDSRGDGNG